MASKPLDTLDQSIVTLLQLDGRLPSLEIARRLNVSEKTVRTRIARLTQEQGMRVVATLNGLDHRTRMLFLVHTAPGCRFEVAEQLARFEDVQRVYATTGAFDLVVEGAFLTDADALEFLVHDVESVEGVDSCESVHLIKEILRTPPSPAGAADANMGSDLDFRRFAALAARAENVDDLLKLVAEAARSVCQADRALISLFEIRSSPLAAGRLGTMEPAEIRVSHTEGSLLSDRYVQEVIRRVNAGIARGVSYRVAESGLHVFVEDALTDPLMEGLRDLVVEEGYSSLMAVPVFDSSRVVGNLNLYYNKPRHLTGDDIAVAQAFADQVGLAVSRAWSSSCGASPGA